MVCAWGHSFPTPQRVDKSIHFGIHALSEDVHLVYQAHVHKFLPKRAWHQGIMQWHHASYDDVLVTWGISDDNIRGIKGRMCKWEGVPSFDFIE